MEALGKYGADAIRWYFYTNSAPWLPNRFHEKAVTEGQSKFMGTLWNTYAFYVLYAEIDQFNPLEHELDFESLSVMDRWLLSKLNSAVKTFDENLSNYRIPEAAKALAEFVDDMSNWYVRRCRERYWVKGMPQDKVNAYMTLYTALVTVSQAAAPMVPFITENIYQNLVRNIDSDAPISIHLCEFPEVQEELIDTELEQAMDEVLKTVVFGRAARNTANVKNRQPLAAMYVKAPEALDTFYTDIIKDELNVKTVEFRDDVSGFTSYSFKPQLKTVGPKYGKLLGGIRSYLTDSDGSKLMAELKANGVIRFDVNGETVELAEEDLLIETAQSADYVSEGDNTVTVVLDVRLTPELIEEGFVREVISKVQTQRKEADFEVTDRITLYISGNDTLAGIVQKNEEQLKGAVLATDIVYDAPAADAYTKEWDINKEHVTLGVARK